MTIKTVEKAWNKICVLNDKILRDTTNRGCRNSTEFGRLTFNDAHYLAILESLLDDISDDLYEIESPDVSDVIKYKKRLDKQVNIAFEIVNSDLSSHAFAVVPRIVHQVLAELEQESA